ncbi:MAG: molybdopterin-dependent oxidoreductase [Tissierellia bacterium]|nr:molybdopterin-dependent oxidoreductase [Tissierellia bacterium]
MAKGICTLCSGNCGIEVMVEDNKVLSVKGDKEHPISKGFTCPKGRALPEMLYAKDRLSCPMKKDENGNWHEISYEEAIDIIVEKFTYLKENFGSESLAVHTGEAGVRKQFSGHVRRFGQAYGTPNQSSAGSHCHLSKEMANKMTVGVLPSADYKNSKCIVLWGYNPMNSRPSQMMDINKAINNGAKLIVVDPQKTYTAKRADVHLQLRPGTDGALALGLIHIIIEEELYDKDFVEEWTVGFDKLVELVKDYIPEKVEKITDVPKELIVEGARIFANNKPGNISPGIAIELLSNGFQTARAISILQAIMGYIDIIGGATMSPPPPLSSLELENVKYNREPIGKSEYPLFCANYNSAQANIFSDAILEDKPYPLKGMMIIGSNPILTWPNVNKLREALKALDFLVVMDNFMTETAKMADIIIPGTFPIERYEIWNGVDSSGDGIVGLAPKLIESKQGISECKFISDIAKGMGLEEAFPWNSDEEAIGYRFQKIGKTFEEMLNMNYGYKYRTFEEKKYTKNGFNTPSKKVEIYSTTLEKSGYDPLPIYNEPAESPLSTKELAEEYPLVLSTGARYLQYYHSRYRNIESLNGYKSQEEVAKVKINPQIAERKKIKDGDMVKVESLRGSIKLKAEITEDVLPTTALISHGWNDANANELTDNENLDPISGFPPDRALLVKLTSL